MTQVNKKMWTNILLFLWIIGTVKHKSTPIPRDCAKHVQRCPVEKDQWAQKNVLLKCPKYYGYVCLRDASGYLFETCMANFTIQANSKLRLFEQRNVCNGESDVLVQVGMRGVDVLSGHWAGYMSVKMTFQHFLLGDNTCNCPTLFACQNNKPYLGRDTTYYHCPEDMSGCPPRNHAEYNIHQLYKYPKCIDSRFSAEIGKTSRRSSTPVFNTTVSTDEMNRQDNKHIVIGIVVSAVLFAVFTVVGSIISYVLYSRKINHEYAEVTYVNNDENTEENYEDLRRWILSINESVVDGMRILPLKENDTIEIDRIYVPVVISEKKEKQIYGIPSKETMSEIIPEEFFYIAPGSPARFIYMVGDAGYGKTVQCRRITETWCKAWKAENPQDVNSEKSKKGKVKELGEVLKTFAFLFYVPMRDVSNKHVSVNDIIHDYYRRFETSNERLTDILTVLKDNRYQCLIILDGLDEWNVSESMKGSLLNRGLPNRNDISNCTILFTMRSWRLLEIDPICRFGLFDKVVRLHGLDDDGIEELTTNMLCNYFNMEKNPRHFREQYKNIKKKYSSSLELGSLMKIPLLAVFCILTWHENIEFGHTKTTFYLSLIETLMQRQQIGQKREEKKQFVCSVLKDYRYVQSRMPEICYLGKIAYQNSASQNATFVLSDAELKTPGIRETVDLFISIGLLSIHDATGEVHENNSRFRFLHKTIQEFIFSLYLVHDKTEVDILEFFINEGSDIEKVLELSTVLTFVSGLSPAVGCKISRYIARLSSRDEDIIRFRDNFSTETYNKVVHLFNLQLSCYREVRGRKSIRDFHENELKFSFSDIILIGNDTDKLTIRESADVLRYHSNDIISLCMKFIPNDSNEGITNIELTYFLHRSESLIALDIDGYDRGKCRLFDISSKRIPCLRTLGLFNVAFSDNILTDFLTKEESKRRIHALGLFYIKSADDLDVDFQYEFSSIHRLNSVRSGYVQKQIVRTSSEITTDLLKERENKKPLLRAILEVLPEYHYLSTLYVSYMDSEEDRKMLLQVLADIQTLEHFGYGGSSVCLKSNDEFDTSVISVLLKIKQLRILYLNNINLNEKVLKIETLSKLERVTLEVIRNNVSGWSTFVSSVSKIKSLRKVVLNDTNIDDESYKKLHSVVSLEVVFDGSTDWAHL